MIEKNTIGSPQTNNRLVEKVLASKPPIAADRF